MTPDSPEHPQETPRHQKALEIFIGLGDSRSYRQVADKVGVTLATIKRWAKAHGWQTKVRERDAQIARKIADRTLETVVEDIDKKRKLIRAALIRLGQAIAQGKIRMQLSDLDRLIRLDGLMSGHPDGIPKTAVSGASSAEELRAYLDMTPTYVLEKLEEQMEQEHEQEVVEQAEQDRRHQEAVEDIARQRRKDAGLDTKGS